MVTRHGATVKAFGVADASPALDALPRALEFPPFR
jgi:hypothetical protein